MKATSILLLLGWIFLLTSCTTVKEFDSKEELLTFLTDKENGYSQTKSVNGVDFSMMYRPTDLMVSQELSSTYDQQELTRLRDRYNKNLYFTITLSKNNQEVLNSLARNRRSFGAMVQQLSFDMGEKVHLFNSKKDTIPLADYNYPRMYGMSNSTSLLFVFPRDERLLNDTTINLTIEDLGLATGEVKFKIPVDKLQHQPEIAFQNN